MRLFLSLVVSFLTASLALPVAAQTSAEWQQRVAYEMDVRLLADRHQMEGFQRLTYYNNSPDTLHRVFYHLYFNAFQPTSMMAERNRHLPDPDRRVVPRIFELGPDEIGYHRVLSLTQNGRPVTYRVNDTVLEVELAEPILPGGSAVMEMTFASQVPLQTRRNGRDNREGIDFSMAQWYPKIAAYDERGWHNDPYIGREFYAPFGTFDVRLTLPAHYVVGATGVLQNPDEVGHGYQNDTTAVYTYEPTDSLTWHFVAENVHDFAWAADPDYIHDRITDDLGITYHLFYQPDVAQGWRAMRRWVPALIQFFSANIGPYPYPQFTVMQAGDGGMEYPMVNFITGGRTPSSLLGVTAHEAAHEWFYAALASNEADYAWMDEGFTDYWTTEAVSRLLGLGDPSHASAGLSVLRAQNLGLFERLNTPSDWFRTNSGYGTAAYSGGHMIAELLGYVLSEPVRDAFFREYYRRYLFRHPNPYDVEAVAEDVSGLVLDWFFEQFVNTDWTLDYAIADVDARRQGDGWHTTIVLEREGDAVLPVDLRLTLEDGSVRWVNIPLVIMGGHKPVPDDWIVAEPWPWTATRYVLELSLPARVKEAVIDPLHQTPERTRLNDRHPFPLHASFLNAPSQTWDRYNLGYRPLASYADDFGFGAGLQARGTYLFGDHALSAMVTLWPQVLASGGEDPSLDFTPAETSVFDGIDYEFSYERTVRSIGPFATASVQARKHLGVMENTISVRKQLGRFASLRQTNRRVTVALQHQFVPSDRRFTLGGVPFFSREHVASAVLSYEVARGMDRLALGAEVGMGFGAAGGGLAGSPGSQASRLFVEAEKGAALGALRGLASVKLGLGSEALAFHKRFRLGAATAEEAWRDDTFRTLSAPFDDALTEAHLAALGEPGPVAYLLAADGTNPASPAPAGTPVGTSMIAGSLTLTTPPVAQTAWLRPLTLHAFSGAGAVGGKHALGSNAFLADAGLGLTYDVAQLPILRRWTAQSDVLSGLRLTARFPVWVSHPELIDEGDDPFAFRWIIGVSR